MNRIVDRDSTAMKQFSVNAHEIANAMEATASHLRQMLYVANGYMRDRSGQTAISIVAQLVEETTVAVNRMRTIADSIRKSAELLEESDGLLQ